MTNFSNPLPPQGPQDPQEPQSPRSAYDAILDRLADREQKARDSETLRAFNLAVQSNPDLEAEAQKLSQQINVPKDVIVSDPKWARTLMAQQEALRLMASRQDPVLRDQLTDPEFAAIAWDDLRNLGFGERIAGNWRAGQLEVERGRIGTRYRQTGELSDADRERLTYIDQQLQEELPSGHSWTGGPARMFGQFSQTLPTALAYGATAAGTAAAVGALAPTPEEIVTVPSAFFYGLGAGVGVEAFKTEGGNAFIDYLNAGYDVEVAAQMSTYVGVVNAGFEVLGGIGLGAPAKRFASDLIKRRLAKKAGENIARLTKGQATMRALLDTGKAVASEVGTETTQEWWLMVGEEAARVASNTMASRMASGYVGVVDSPLRDGREGDWTIRFDGEGGVQVGAELFEAVTGKSISAPFTTLVGEAKDYFAREYDTLLPLESAFSRGEVIQRLLDTAEFTIKGVWLPGAAAPAVRLIGDRHRIRQAQRAHEILEQAQNNTLDSKVQQRNADRYTKFWADNLQGEAAETVRISKAKFAEKMKASNVTEEQLEAELPEVARQLREPSEISEHIEIPMSEWLGRKMFETDLGQALREDLKIGGENAMSFAEARQYESAVKAQAEKIRKAVDETLDEDAEKTFNDEGFAIQKRVRTDLNDLGIYTRQQVNVMSAFQRNAVQIGALREQITPAQFEEKYGALRYVKMPDGGAGRVQLRQGVLNFGRVERMADIRDTKAFDKQFPAALTAEDDDNFVYAIRFKGEGEETSVGPREPVGDTDPLASVPDVWTEKSGVRYWARLAAEAAGDVEQPLSVVRVSKAAAEFAAEGDAESALTLDEQATQDAQAQTYTLKGTLKPEAYAKKALDDLLATKLMATHSLDADTLVKTLDKLDGKFPAPSVAVSRADLPVVTFGKVTLIGDKNLVDPESGVPMFEGDVWTSKFPRIETGVSTEGEATLNRMLAAADADAEKAGVKFPDAGVSVEFGAEVKDVNSLRMQYAIRKELGELSEVPTREVKNLTAFNWLEGNEALFSYFKREGQALVDRIGDTRLVVETPAELAELFESASEQDLKLLARVGMSSDAIVVSKLRELMAEIDTLGTSVINRQKIEGRPKDGRRRVTKFFEDRPNLIGDTIELDGKRVLATAENILKRMKTDPVALAELVPTATSLKAVLAYNAAKKPFATLDEARAQMGRLKTRQPLSTLERFHESYNAWRVQTTRGIRERGPEAARALADVMDLKDLTAVNAAEVMSKFGFADAMADPELAQATAALAEEIRDLGVSYFEAKPQRLVDISDFKAAIVPMDADDALVDRLAKAGLKVRKYAAERLAEADRTLMISDMLAELDADDILFQNKKEQKSKTPVTGPTFSALSRAIESIQSKKAQPAKFWRQQLKTWLNKAEVKPDEVYWTGFDNLLDLVEASKTKLTPAQMLEAFTGEEFQTPEFIGPRAAPETLARAAGAGQVEVSEFDAMITPSVRVGSSGYPAVTYREARNKPNIKVGTLAVTETYIPLEDGDTRAKNETWRTMKETDEGHRAAGDYDDEYYEYSLYDAALKAWEQENEWGAEAPGVDARQVEQYAYRSRLYRGIDLIADGKTVIVDGRLFQDPAARPRYFLVNRRNLVTQEQWEALADNDPDRRAQLTTHLEELVEKRKAELQAADPDGPLTTFRMYELPTPLADAGFGAEEVRYVVTGEDETGLNPFEDLDWENKTDAVKALVAEYPPQFAESLNANTSVGYIDFTITRLPDDEWVLTAHGLRDGDLQIADSETWKGKKRLPPVSERAEPKYEEAVSAFVANAFETYAALKPEKFREPDSPWSGITVMQRTDHKMPKGYRELAYRLVPTLAKRVGKPHRGGGMHHHFLDSLMWIRVYDVKDADGRRGLWAQEFQSDQAAGGAGQLDDAFKYEPDELGPGTPVQEAFDKLDIQLSDLDSKLAESRKALTWSLGQAAHDLAAFATDDTEFQRTDGTYVLRNFKPLGEVRQTRVEREQVGPTRGEMRSQWGLTSNRYSPATTTDARKRAVYAVTDYAGNVLGIQVRLVKDSVGGRSFIVKVDKPDMGDYANDEAMALAARRVQSVIGWLDRNLNPDEIHVRAYWDIDSKFRNTILQPMLKKSGFSTDYTNTPKNFGVSKREIDEMEGEWVASAQYNDLSETRQVSQRIEKERPALQKKRDVAKRAAEGKGRIPRAPFITSMNSWVEFALKRVAALAVKENYDFIVFVTGDENHVASYGKLSGQRGFYDKFLPTVMKNLFAKKTKVKIEDIPVPSHSSVAVSDGRVEGEDSGEEVGRKRKKLRQAVKDAQNDAQSLLYRALKNNDVLKMHEEVVGGGGSVLMTREEWAHLRKLGEDLGVEADVVPRTRRERGHDYDSYVFVTEAPDGKVRIVNSSEEHAIYEEEFNAWRQQHIPDPERESSEAPWYGVTKTVPLAVSFEENPNLESEAFGLRWKLRETPFLNERRYAVKLAPDPDGVNDYLLPELDITVEEGIFKVSPHILTRDPDPAAPVETIRVNGGLDVRASARLRAAFREMTKSAKGSLMDLRPPVLFGEDGDLLKSAAEGGVALEDRAPELDFVMDLGTRQDYEPTIDGLPSDYFARVNSQMGLVSSYTGDPALLGRAMEYASAETSAIDLNLVEEAFLEIQRAQKGAAWNKGFYLNDKFRKKFGGEQPLFQDADSPRGAIDLTSMVAALGPKADVSTFFHESAHYYFETMLLSYQSGAATEELTQDLDTLAKWGGFASVEEMASATRAERKKLHEAFAYSFEFYLSEGTPQTADRSLLNNLRKIRRWISKTYKDAVRENTADMYEREFGEEIPAFSEEIRAVMDRVLQTQEMIDYAKKVRSVEALFDITEGANLSAEQLAALRRLAVDADFEAEEKLGASMLRQLRYLKNFRSRFLRDVQKQARAARRKVEEEERERLELDPIHRLQAFLNTGKFINAQGEPEPHGLPSTRLLNSAGARKLPEKWKSETGLAADVLARPFGFQSGDDMLELLTSAPSLDEAVKQRADRRMLAENNELLDEKEIENRLIEAMSGPAMQKLIAAQIRAFDQGLPNVRVLTAAAREVARRVIGDKRVDAIRPLDYSLAAGRAQRAAAEARQAGDLTTYRAELRRALFQTALAEEAARVRDEIRGQTQTARERFQRRDKKLAQQRRLTPVVKLGRQILSRYGVTTPPPEVAQDPTVDVLAPLQDETQFPQSLYEELNAQRNEELANAVPFETLTVEEARDLFDTLDGLWFRSKREQDVLLDGKRAALETVLTEMEDTLDQHTKSERKVAGSLAKNEKRGRWLRKQRAQFKRMEFALKTLDRGKPDGIFTRSIWRRAKDAANQMRLDETRYLKRVQTALDKLDLPGDRIVAKGLAGGKDLVFGNDDTSGKAQLLMAVLHSGNESNLFKFTVGYGIASYDPRTNTVEGTDRWLKFVQQKIDDGTITKQDMDFVQSMWDLNEELKPVAQRAHFSIFGYKFDEIQASPLAFTFPGEGEVTYRGGYVPAATDPNQVVDAELNNIDEKLQFQTRLPTVPRGFTKNRAALYAKPLDLDLRRMGTHIHSVLLFSHLAPAMQDLRRITENPRFKNAIDEVDPVFRAEVLVPWMESLASQRTTASGKDSWGWLNRFRSRAGAATMFFNIKNSAQNLTGIPVALTVVERRYLFPALADVARDREGALQRVKDQSPYMRDRLENANIYEVRDRLEALLTGRSTRGKVVAWFEKNAYWVQRVTQEPTDAAVWLGAYEKAIVDQGASVDGDKAHREAVQRADAAVRQTQTSNNPEDLSPAERGSAMAKLFLQFRGWFISYGNLVSSEAQIRATGGEANGGLGALYMIGIFTPLVSAELIDLLVDGDPVDEDEDGALWDDLMERSLRAHLSAIVGAIPYWGDAGAVAFATFFDPKSWNSRMPEPPTLSVLRRGLGAVRSGDYSDARKLRSVLSMIATLTGIPVNKLLGPAMSGYELSTGQADLEGQFGPAIEVPRAILTGRTNRPR